MRSSISWRIGVGLLLILLLQVVLLVTMGVSVTTYRTNAVLLASETIPQATTINTVYVTTQRATLESLHYIINTEPEHLAHFEEAVQQAEASLTTLREEFAQDSVHRSEEQAAFADFEQAVMAALASATDVVRQRQQGADIAMDAVTDSLDAASDQVETPFAALSALLDEEAAEAQTATQTNPLLLPAVIGVLTLAVSVVFFVLLVRTVVHPLRSLHTAALGVAAGVWDRPLSSSGAGEIGALNQAFTTMTTTVREQIATAQAARAEAEAAQAQMAAQFATIAAQQDAIRELSVPLLPLSDTALVLPLVGALDTTRLQHVQDQTLQAVAAHRTRHLIVDVTGVPVMDQQVTEGMVKLVHMIRLLGAEVIVVGIRPEVAQALVATGQDLRELTTQSTLQSGVISVLGDTIPSA